MKIYNSVILLAATILLVCCNPLEDIERYLDSHVIFDENAEMSVIPGVLVERSDDRLFLDFDNEVTEETLKGLRLVDYVEKVPGELPQSIPGVVFSINPENDNQVIVDFSSVDCGKSRPVTLISAGDEISMAHMMLVHDSKSAVLQDGEKTHTAVISDIHLNDSRSQKYGWAWCRDNKQNLIDYLDYLIKNAGSYRELVLLGDIFDEFVTPVPYATFAREDGTPVSEKEYFDLIAEANREVIDKMKEVQESGIGLIYIPGNHDCGIDADDVHRIFGEKAEFVSDVRGLGTYLPEYASEITMEHGHRYDVMCSPDMFSNIGVDDVTADNAFMGPQYFTSRIGATHDYNEKKADDNLGDASLEDFNIDEEFVRNVANGIPDNSVGSDDFNLFVTKAVWNVVTIAKYVPDLDKNPVPTGLHGLTRDYLPSQYSYLGADPEPELYSTMYKQKEWEERLKRNNAPSGFPYILGTIMCEIPYMDTFAVSWIAGHDTDHRLFVWGHSHNPMLMAELDDDRGRGYIYVNTGSWVDDSVSNFATRSFVDLYFGKDGYIQTSIKQIDKDGSVKNLYNPMWLKK